MIDVADCDARLPSSGDDRDLYLDQLVRLSVIVGKVMKNIYTYARSCSSLSHDVTHLLCTIVFSAMYRPAGLNVTTDVQLQGILDELENWKANLPDELQFRGPETPTSGGMFFSFSLFWPATFGAPRRRLCLCRSDNLTDASCRADLHQAP
jgi:hypothetical protein